MTRSRRWLFRGAILLLIGLVVAFAYIYFVSTQSALQRAEDFRFRRMQVTQIGDDGAYRFFYVSNRSLDPGDGSMEERFGTGRDEVLKFGLFDTEIKTTLGLGMIINPTEWFQNEEIRLHDVRALDREAFVDQVTQQVRESPSQSLLIIVHGFREAFSSALRKTAFLGHILDIDSPVLVFDWPGDQGSSLRGYRRARRIARESGAELAHSMKLIIDEIRPARLWLVANSMGGQVVVDAFSLLYREADLADTPTEIEDVVLTAPDVGREEFNREFKDQIKALAENLTVYVSSNDRALLVSRILNRGRRLGESTLDPSNPDQSDEVFQAFALVDPTDELVTLVDVTPVNRTRNFHNFSLETPEFFDDLYLRLTNPEQPRNRLIYPVRITDGRLYWVLTRGR